MSDHRSDPRDFHGPKTWAMVRERYLAGESAPSLARAFGIGQSTLRKRAQREGWTRMQHAAALEPRRAARPADGAAPRPSSEPETIRPDAALQAALAQASGLLAAGRAAEASALLKAAETLARLTQPSSARAEHRGRAPPEPVPLEEQTPYEELLQWSHRMAHRDFEEIERRALQLLSEPCHLPSGVSPYAFAWRARHLGPEVAARDYQAGLKGGWARSYWDEEGRLLDVYAVAGVSGRPLDGLARAEAEGRDGPS